MKKLVAFALILSLGMFSVVGCGGTTTTKPSDKGAPAKGSGKGRTCHDSREDEVSFRALNALRILHR